jgi:hypothetical protein
LFSESAAQSLPATPIIPIGAVSAMQADTGYSLPKDKVAFQYRLTGNIQTGFKLTAAGTNPAKVVVNYTGGEKRLALKLKLTFKFLDGVQNKSATYTTTATTPPDADKGVKDAPTTYSFDLSDVAKAVITDLNSHLPSGFEPTKMSPNAILGAAELSVLRYEYDATTGKPNPQGVASVKNSLTVTFTDMLGDIGAGAGSKPADGQPAGDAPAADEAVAEPAAP